MTSRPPVAVPRALVVIAWLVVAISVGFAVVGATRIGVNMDEPIHQQRFENYLRSGWYLADFQVDREAEPQEGVTDQYVYGPATMAVLHGLGRMVGTDDVGEINATAAAYTVRHLGLALIGVLGMVIVAATVRTMIGRWDWGIVAAALLGATPMWTGYAMFNVKDVSVGTGYAAYTLALVLMLRFVRTGGERRPVAWVATAALLAASLWLTLGTRPAMWGPLGASGLAWLGLTLMLNRGRPRRRLVAPALVVGGAVVVAYLGLLALYPRVFSAPLHAALRSADSSATFLGIESSQTYVPVMVLTLVPEVILALVVIGCVAAARGLVRSWRRPTLVAAGIGLLAVQCFLLPIASIVRPAPLYGDLRQLLFAAPAAAAIAAVGGYRFCERASRAADRQVIKLVTVLVSIGLIVPVVAQTAMFPYQYGAYNLLMEVARAQDRAPLDFYGGSLRELVDQPVEAGWVSCIGTQLTNDSTVGSEHESVRSRSSKLRGSFDCATGSSMVSPFIRRSGSEADASPRGSVGLEFWSAAPGSGDAPNCQLVRAVNRRAYFLRELTLSTWSRCHLDYPTLDTASLTERPSTPLLEYGWWVVDPASGGAEALADRPRLAFAVPEALRGRPLTLRLTTVSSAGIASAAVDGRALPVSKTASGAEIEIPGDLAVGTPEQPVVVELAVPSEGTDRLWLRELALVARS